MKKRKFAPIKIPPSNEIAVLAAQRRGFVVGVDGTLARQLPIYIRLPEAGDLCPWTSLSRSTLNSLIRGASPLVRSYSVYPGKKHSARLIDFLSLVQYLEGRQQQEQAPAPPSQNGSEAEPPPSAVLDEESWQIGGA
jgi:hypothetical protein